MNKNYLQTILLTAAMLLCVGGWASAAEIITAEDIKEQIVTKEVLVKTADNVIVLVDTSSSMAAVSKNYRPKTKYQLEKESLAAGIERLPDLGFNVGIYSFTPWNAIHPVQKFDRDNALAALGQLPAEPSGRTPLVQGLNQLDGVLSGLTGKTIVYIFTDGGYDRAVAGMGPGDKATELAAKHNVCFQVISHAADPDGRKRVRDMGKANPCSRVIPFDSYITNPYYALSPLYYVKSGTEVITSTEKMITGIKLENILFDFNRSDLTAQARAELDALGKFLQQKPNATAYMMGYTDAIGSQEYNLGLSQRRAESAAAYLMNTYNIGSTRIVTNWYGKLNPVADNDTEEGRALNRRVEITVGGK
jgi:OOP family OmpA-OmpF porin